jgi:hypothetical protein
VTHRPAEPDSASEQPSPEAVPADRDPAFTKVKRPGSQVFTKFGDVKSRRFGWTADRRQRLELMWDRGDKVADIADALGCKLGAVNVARAASSRAARSRAVRGKSRTSRRTRSSAWRSSLRG